MAGTITYDMDGSVFSTGTFGDRWTRQFFAADLEATDIPSIYAEVFVLLPDTGTPAPAPIVNMYVSEVQIDRVICQDATTPLSYAQGAIIYLSPTSSGFVPDDDGVGVTLSGGGSVQDVTVFYDILGAQLLTTYDNVTMAHQGDGFIVTSSPTFTRTEITSPRARSDIYVGKLNSDIWNGYAAGTVLCSSIEGESQDRGATFVNTYTFQIRPDGWEATFIHDDPFFPGNPIPNPTGAAVASYDLIKRVAFSPLNITLA